MDTETTMLMDAGRTSMCLYVFSPSKQERLYQLQMETLSDRLHTLTEHHITIAEVFEHEQGHIGDEELPHEGCSGLRQQFHILPGQFKVVLASDSAVKLRAESCISCEEVIMRIENEPTETKNTFY
ncbi:MAG: DUF4174 domain-containing protein [Phycisphaerae bacterium]|nr:DUF4174 domain-containing protein [Phycisphaerae bacterium]